MVTIEEAKAEIQLQRQQLASARERVLSNLGGGAEGRLVRERQLSQIGSTSQQVSEYEEDVKKAEEEYQKQQAEYQAKLAEQQAAQREYEAIKNAQKMFDKGIPSSFLRGTPEYKYLRQLEKDEKEFIESEKARLGLIGDYTLKELQEVKITEKTYIPERFSITPIERIPIQGPKLPDVQGPKPLEPGKLNISPPSDISKVQPRTSTIPNYGNNIKELKTYTPQEVLGAMQQTVKERQIEIKTGVPYRVYAVGEQIGKDVVSATSKGYDYIDKNFGKPIAERWISLVFGGRKELVKTIEAQEKKEKIPYETSFKLGGLVYGALGVASTFGATGTVAKGVNTLFGAQAVYSGAVAVSDPSTRNIATAIELTAGPYALSKGVNKLMYFITPKRIGLGPIKDPFIQSMTAETAGGKRVTGAVITIGKRMETLQSPAQKFFKGTIFQRVFGAFNRRIYTPETKAFVGGKPLVVREGNVETVYGLKFQQLKPNVKQVQDVVTKTKYRVLQPGQFKSKDPYVQRQIEALFGIKRGQFYQIKEGQVPIVADTVVVRDITPKTTGRKTFLLSKARTLAISQTATVGNVRVTRFKLSSTPTTYPSRPRRFSKGVGETRQQIVSTELPPEPVKPIDTPKEIKPITQVQNQVLSKEAIITKAATEVAQSLPRVKPLQYVKTISPKSVYGLTSTSIYAGTGQYERTEPTQGLLPGQIGVTKPDVFVETGSRIDTTGDIKTRFVLKTPTAEEQKKETIVGPFFGTDINIKSDLGLKDRTDTKLDLGLKQGQGQKQDLRQLPDLTTITEITTFQTPEKPPRPEEPKKPPRVPGFDLGGTPTRRQQAIDKLVGAYSIFIRKSGKDILAGTAGSEEEAKKILKTKLERTIARSGFIKAGKQKIKVDLGVGFRPSKVEGAFRPVQLKERALSARGEVKDILRARKSKRRTKWF